MPSVERLHHEAQPQMHSFRIPDEKDFPRTLNRPITTASLDPLNIRISKNEKKRNIFIILYYTEINYLYL